MVLADPDGMHAKLVGVECLGSDVGDELIWRAGIVLVMIVAECKVAEVHRKRVLPVALRDTLHPLEILEARGNVAGYVLSQGGHADAREHLFYVGPALCTASYAKTNGAPAGPND